MKSKLAYDALEAISFMKQTAALVLKASDRIQEFGRDTSILPPHYQGRRCPRGFEFSWNNKEDFIDISRLHFWEAVRIFLHLEHFWLYSWHKPRTQQIPIVRWNWRLWDSHLNLLWFLSASGKITTRALSSMRKGLLLSILTIFHRPEQSEQR